MAVGKIKRCQYCRDEKRSAVSGVLSLLGPQLEERLGAVPICGDEKRREGRLKRARDR